METINLIYLLAIISSFFLTLILTPFIKGLALKYNITDKPGADRKIHHKPIPLLGGLAIFISTSMVIFVFRWLELANFSQIPDKFLISVFLAGLILMVGGFLDDRYNLRPGQQIIFPIIAVVLVLVSGIQITYITNPIGNASNAIIYLSPVIGLTLSFLWLMGMMYTTKFLDGLDGLVASMAIIAALIIFLIGLDWDVARSATGVWALALIGAAAAFLIFNWHPAKVFLGEGGSIWLGFILGVLSIITGSKIATTLLVVGIPALDVLWVVIRRAVKHESPFSHADKKHLHYQLLNLGFSHRGAVFFLCLIALTFGSLGIFTNSRGKLTGLVFLFILMMILALAIYLKSRRNESTNIDHP
mgnify:CR=1 FL=1